MLTLDKIYKASHVLRSVIRKTDLIHAPLVNPDSEIYLKTENLQITGSFKVRGAYYMMSQLTEEEKARGVIACSAGNHAQGVALAAAKNHIKSLICLPDGAPISKVEASCCGNIRCWQCSIALQRAIRNCGNSSSSG